MGAAANAYGNTLKPPSYGAGDSVKAKGRYRSQTVDSVIPNGGTLDGGNDGHAYVVSGGKTGRKSVHLSGELRPFEMGTEELQ